VSTLCKIHELRIQMSEAKHGATSWKRSAAARSWATFCRRSWRGTWRSRGWGRHRW